MSAFFVSRHVIHDTVQAWITAHPKPRPMAELDAMGRTLWRLNVAALRQRYPHHDHSGSAAEVESYHFTPPNAPEAQIAKSVHCLLYQCGEGDIPEKSQLYRALETLAQSVGRPLGYDQAEWDRCA